MAETRRTENLQRQSLTRTTDWADRLVEKWNAEYKFKDTFENGNNKWRYHIQYNQAYDRGSPALSGLNSMRGRSLALSTSNDQSEQVMLRKSRGGFMLPEGVKWIVMGYECSVHSWWKYGLYRFWFTLDLQKENTRHWFKIAHEWSNNGTNLIDNRWMVDLNTADTESFTYFETAGIKNAAGTAVADDQQIIPWNEPPKNMFFNFAMVINAETMNYHRMYCNDREYNMEGLTLGTGASLSTDYYNGLNQMVILQNRSTGTTLMSGLEMDLAFTAFSYAG